MSINDGGEMILRWNERQAVPLMPYQVPGGPVIPFGRRPDGAYVFDLACPEADHICKQRLQIAEPKLAALIKRDALAQAILLAARRAAAEGREANPNEPLALFAEAVQFDIAAHPRGT